MHRSTSLFCAHSGAAKLCAFEPRDAESEIEGGRPSMDRGEPWSVHFFLSEKIFGIVFFEVLWLVFNLLLVGPATKALRMSRFGVRCWVL